MNMLGSSGSIFCGQMTENVRMAQVGDVFIFSVSIVSKNTKISFFPQFHKINKEW